MQKQFIIIGGGGHTGVLIAMLQASNLPVGGIITSNPSLLGKSLFDVNYIGMEGEVKLNPAEVVLVNGVGNRASSNGSGLGVRADIYRREIAAGFEFPAIISRDAVVQPHAKIAAGVQLMPGVVIQSGVTIAENVIVNTTASIDHDSSIGAHCHIAPGAVICGNVTIGEMSHIGAAAVVIQGIKIGRNVVVGAGAVITTDVPDDSVVFAATSLLQKNF
jgi:UDP-perosamine 4-acetyltransferase